MLPDDEKQREHPITWRPPEKLRNEFYRLAKASGLSTNAFITKAVFYTYHPPGQDGKAPNTKPRIDPKDAARLLEHIGKIGSNINQIAKHANAGKYMVNSVEAACTDIIEMRAAVLEFLGKKP